MCCTTILHSFRFLPTATNHHFSQSGSSALFIQPSIRVVLFYDHRLLADSSSALARFRLYMYISDTISTIPLSAYSYILLFYFTLLYVLPSNGWLMNEVYSDYEAKAPPNESNVNLPRTLRCDIVRDIRRNGLLLFVFLWVLWFKNSFCSVLYRKRRGGRKTFLKCSYFIVTLLLGVFVRYGKFELRLGEEFEIGFSISCNSTKGALSHTFQFLCTKYSQNTNVISQHTRTSQNYIHHYETGTAETLQFLPFNQREDLRTDIEKISHFIFSHNF